MSCGPINMYIITQSHSDILIQFGHCLWNSIKANKQIYCHGHNTDSTLSEGMVRRPIIPNSSRDGMYVDESGETLNIRASTFRYSRWAGGNSCRRGGTAAATLPLHQHGAGSSMLLKNAFRQDLLRSHERGRLLNKGIVKCVRDLYIWGRG
jgi:hypothetical protein